MSARFFRVLFAFAISLALLTVQAVPAQDVGLSGFDHAGAERQRATEARFDALLRRENLREWMKRLSARPCELAADPAETFVAPERQEPAPYLNFAPLQNSLARLQQSARSYQAALADSSARARPADSATRDRLNAVLIRAERAMTREEGLPRRPWFKHQIYAPGFYTGYGVKTLPAVREAIEQRDWREAETHIPLVAATFDKVTSEIDVATALLKSP